MHHRGQLAFHGHYFISFRPLLIVDHGVYISRARAPSIPFIPFLSIDPRARIDGRTFEEDDKTRVCPALYGFPGCRQRGGLPFDGDPTELIPAKSALRAGKSCAYLPCSDASRKTIIGSRSATKAPQYTVGMLSGLDPHSRTRRRTTAISASSKLPAAIRRPGIEGWHGDGFVQR